MTAAGNGSAWTFARWRISCGANDAATPSAAVSAALSVINRRVEFVAGRLLAASSSSAAAGRRVGALDVHHPAVDEYVADPGRLVEQVAARHDDVGDLALLERADAIGGTGDLRGVDRQRAERGLGRQALP